MKNNDALKKHHFWILVGLVPLLVLIAVIMITSGVGGAISERKAAIEKAQKEIASKSNPKPVKLIQEMDKLIERVASKRGDLWKANWESQKHIYIWPKSRNFDNFARKVKKLAKQEDKEVEMEVLEPVRLEDLKFGDPIPNNADQYAAFKSPSLYLAMYSNADPKQGRSGTGIADQVAPTQFLGGWQSVLRHVAAFPERQLTSEQIWLLMEDYWVQRALLLDLKGVNDQIAAFTPVRYEDNGQVIDDPQNPQGPQNPLRRRFQSRIWEVTLEVKQRGNQRYLEGELRNLTDRVQILGINRSMTLKVWLDAGPNGSVDGIQPVEFKIGGEYVPGRGATRFAKDSQGKDIAIPADRIVIRPDANDTNLSKYPNVIPPGTNVTRIAKVEQVFDATTVPIRRIDALALGYTDSRWAMKTKLVTRQGTLMGAGTLESVVDANRRRYVDVTDQVRRMPVALVIVVDQDYMQDVLLSLANSPLRFQVTQVTWNRFRGKLDYGPGGGGLRSGDEILYSGPGELGEGFGLAPGTGYPGSGGFTGPPGGTSDVGTPPGFPPGIGVPPGMGSSGFSGPPGLGVPGTGGYNPYGPAFPGSGGVLSEAQLTSGLIELSIYGIVSLYEKYTPPAETTTPPAGTTPTTPSPPPTPPNNTSTSSSGTPTPPGDISSQNSGTPPSGSNPTNNTPAPPTPSQEGNKASPPPSPAPGKSLDNPNPPVPETSPSNSGNGEAKPATGSPPANTTPAPK